MGLGPDIILVGAGRSPHTRELRRQKGFTRRNRWIGPIQVRTNMRIGVDIDFVKKHHDAIAKAVEDGVLLVEYKFDKFVDAEELQTLAFGSEEERAAYEEEVAALNEERAAELQQKSDERREAEFEARTKSVLGYMPVAKPGASDIPQGEEGGTLDGGAPEQPETEHDPNAPLTDIDQHPDKPGIQATSAPIGNTLHETSTTTPRDIAQRLQEEVSAEPEYTPNSSATEPLPPGEFKPLPDGWKNATKAELLAFSEERGIDTSDTPSNKELRRRLDDYEKRGT